MPIEPDVKDWTWVLERPCPECGFDAPGLERSRVPDAIRDNATLWEVVLGTDDAAVRPSPHVWSPLEYACHVRDVNRLFAERLHLMLTDDDARFDNWDQDDAAVEGGYLDQDPHAVAREVVEAADTVAVAYAEVAEDQWDRRGTRSNGDAFTVDTFARYHLHDLVHHAHDVSHITKRVTVASYDAFAGEYARATEQMPDDVRAAVDRLAEALPQGARVLEIGSGSGRDAKALEQHGVSVRRTDITPGFVQTIRADGYPADWLDPLVDDLADPERDEPYDAAWANASLLHLRREDFPTVLERLAAVTATGGLFALSLKEGDGARFSTHGHVDAPRHFTFWREPQLREVLDAAGWDVESVEHVSGSEAGDPWLWVTACRR